MRFEQGNNIKQAVESIWQDLDGSHNLAVLRRDGSGFVSRDQRGMHPLIIGRINETVVVASEDHAIRHALGNMVKMRDVEPGELLEFQRNQEPISHRIAAATPAHCIFEWWYFAKQWSRLDGASVYTTRHRAGEYLAALDEAQWKQQSIEPIIVPVPNSALAIAAGYQHTLSQLSNVGAIIRNPKNPEVGRTFIAEEKHRKRKVGEKYHFKHEKMSNEHIVLIDDSIVRGPTMREIIMKMRENPSAQPRSIHVRIAFPPVLAPCFYGINMSTLEELFMTKFRLMERDGATQQQIEIEMAKDLGADSVRFLPVSMVSDVLGIDDENLCHACTRAQYPTASGQCKHDANARLLGLLPHI
jgi:amidophosphoribosyltransferase